MEVKPEKYQLTNFIGLPLRISKERESNFTQTSHQDRRKFLVVKVIASEDRKSESSDSSIWDELKFESRKFITSGMDKRKQEDNMTNKDKKIKKMAEREEGAAAS